jgi:hypothetical protein
MKTKKTNPFQDVHLSMFPLGNQTIGPSEESGPQSCQPTTARLGMKPSGNESRDFWRATDIPVESWTNEMV